MKVQTYILFEEGQSHVFYQSDPRVSDIAFDVINVRVITLSILQDYIFVCITFDQCPYDASEQLSIAFTIHFTQNT